MQNAVAMQSSETLDHVAVSITRLPHAADIALPAYATEHAAGMDLCAAIDAPMTMQPGDHALVATGLAIALPPGFEAREGLNRMRGCILLAHVAHPLIPSKLPHDEACRLIVAT